jgi:hypothetical protein
LLGKWPNANTSSLNRIKCRNRIPHIENWPAIRRQSVRPATPSISHNFEQRTKTKAFTCTELDAVAPRYIFHDGTLYDASAYEKSRRRLTSINPMTPPSELTQTLSATTIASVYAFDKNAVTSATKAQYPASDTSHPCVQSTPVSQALQQPQAPPPAYFPGQISEDRISMQQQSQLRPTSIPQALPAPPEPGTICAICLDPLDSFSATSIVPPSETALQINQSTPTTSSATSPPPQSQETPSPPTIRIITYCSHAYHLSCLQTWALRRRPRPHLRPRSRRRRYLYEHGPVVQHTADSNARERELTEEEYGSESTQEEADEPKCPLCMWNLRRGL